MKLSEQDFDLLSHSWKERRGKLYSNKKPNIDGLGRKQHYLHRIVANRVGLPKHRRITVIDGDYHNCMRENVRVCGVTQHDGLLLDEPFIHLELEYKLKLNNRGYVLTETNQLLHNIVWYLFGNELPEGVEVDHKNRNPLDNRIENLRLATRRQQCLNRKSLGNSSELYRVCYKEREGMFVSQIKPANMKSMQLGSFQSEERAGFVSDIGVLYYYTREDLEYTNLNNEMLRDKLEMIKGCATFSQAVELIE